MRHNIFIIKILCANCFTIRCENSLAENAAHSLNLFVESNLADIKNGICPKSRQADVHCEVGTGQKKMALTCSTVHVGSQALVICPSTPLTAAYMLLGSSQPVSVAVPDAPRTAIA